MKKRSIIGWYFSLAMMIALLTALNIQAQQTYQATTVRPQGVTGDLLDLLSVNDDRLDTRAYATGRNYVGKSVIIDAGSLQNIIGVSQDHGRWPTHFPGAYTIEVAENLRGHWFPAWEGEGQRGDSRARFAAILARYIRVTATKTNATYNETWSIAELRIGVDPGQRPRRIPADSGDNTTTPPRETVLRDAAAARDRNEETFATSSTPNYAGMFVTFDLRSEVQLSRIVQIHGSRSEDYPAEYRVEVSRVQSDRGFQEVFRGSGQANRSIARFTPTTARFIRLTATRNRNNVNWWSIAELRTDADDRQPDRDDTDTPDTRAIRNVTGRGFIDLNTLLDQDVATGPTTNTSAYRGSWIQFDLGNIVTVSRVVQIHNPYGSDFPGRYRIEVSTDGGNWQNVFEGAGQEGRSVADFRTARARFVRLTALEPRDNRNWWSIHRLKIRGGDDSTTPPGRETELRDAAAAQDRNEETFATSGTPNYSGMSVTFDLGREIELSRVAQFHGSRSEDYPAEYRIEVSRVQSNRGFQEVFRGSGQANRSVARFTPTTARYIRITATRNRNNVNWWSIAELRTDEDRQPGNDTTDNHAIRDVTGRGFVELNTLLDRNSTTGATTNTASYRGSWVQVDLGSIVTVSQVAQVHNPYQDDFPGRYRIEVSTNGNNWENVYEGAGEQGRSVAEFRTVRARYVRITAVDSRNNRNRWSIQQLRIRG